MLLEQRLCNSRLLNTYTYTNTNQIRIRTIGNDLAIGILVRIGNPANLVRIGSPFAIVDDVKPSFARAKVASKATISEYSKTHKSEEFFENHDEGGSIT